ncbi:AbrB family transcriptional regulator [Afifella sp. IM 167]|uniref:AbrB family transcriptional regulator n=1 Tax=Afifella sp. IM 167 TaxID=2033586 RepID=UPI001CCD6FDA
MLATLAISATGGFLFSLAGVPAAWIAGGMLAVAATTLAGFDSDMPTPLRDLVFLVLGVIAGTGVNPATIHQMVSWPISFVILVVTVFLVALSGYVFFSRFCGWDRNSALFASLPGALSFVLAAAEMTNADMRRVAVAQSLRLIVLLEALPAAAWISGIHPSGMPSRTDAPVIPLELLLLYALGAVGGLILNRLRIPGGIMLGGLTVAAVLYVSGAVTTAVPTWILVPALIGLGAVAGCRLRPEDRHLLKSTLASASGAFVVAVVISAAGAGLVTWLLGVPIEQTFMAFAPGALEALTILAFTLHIDPAYVAAHHVVRFMVLAFSVPLIARWLMRLDASDAARAEAQAAGSGKG